MAAANQTTLASKTAYQSIKQTPIARSHADQSIAAFAEAAAMMADTRKDVAAMAAAVPKTSNPAVVRVMNNARSAILDDLDKVETTAQADYAAALDGMLKLAIDHVPYFNGAKDCSGKITELATMMGITTGDGSDSDDNASDQSDDDQSDDASEQSDDADDDQSDDDTGVAVTVDEPTKKPCNHCGGYHPW